MRFILQLFSPSPPPPPQKKMCVFGQPSNGKKLKFELSLENLRNIKVIGKGSWGVVQLVCHKRVGKLLALKDGNFLSMGGLYDYFHHPLIYSLRFNLSVKLDQLYPDMLI